MQEERFTTAVRQYQKLLFHIAWTMLGNEQDCADAVQEALLAAWRGQERLRDENAMRAWLTRILINACNDVLRKRKRMRLTELKDDLPAQPPVDNLPLREALAALEPKLRLPIVLHYLEGFSVEEIAQTLRIPSGTVKSRMSQGRKTLGQLLGEEIADRSDFQ